MKQRILRLNSLLKEVIAEVISQDIRNPRLAKIITPTSVEMSSNMHNAKVYVSILGSAEEKKESIKILNTASSFIASQAFKKMTIRRFPKLFFCIDTSTDAHMNIDRILKEIVDSSPEPKPDDS